MMNRRLFLRAAAAFSMMLKRPPAFGAPVSGAAVVPGRRMVLVCPTADIEEFNRLAEFAISLGFTHLAVGDLPKARWQWFDPADPWPNWGMLQASFFKIAPPPDLQRWIPADFTAKCRQILAQRGDVLRSFGLKASFHGAEPMWLPEAVYQAYPDWRGPRCQYPPRAHNNYYAPCIDRPEVLALYSKAVAEICRLVPVEEFRFLANDSGSGICWHPGLYPGVNGPEFCRHRSMEERLDGWMSAVAAGAKEAGCKADVTIAGHSLFAGGVARPRVSAGLDSYLYNSQFYPVVDIPRPFELAEALQAALPATQSDCEVHLDSISSAALTDVVRVFITLPAPDRSAAPVSRIQLLADVAVRQAGAKAGPLLLRAWECIERAAMLLAPIDEGGPILLLGSMNQRWLVRPLVLFPLELRSEETKYYRPFQMQAWSEQIASDLMALQGNYLIQGPASTWLAGRIFDQATAQLQTAADALTPAVELAQPPAKASLEELRMRILALSLTIRNAKLTARYQEFLDSFGQTPQQRLDPKWSRPEPEAGMKIVQDDMQNTGELIALLQATNIRPFATASTSAEEDVFLFNPGIIDQLHWKIETEMRHLPEHIRL